MLTEAVCAKCQKTINEDVENHILSKEYIYLRIKHGFPSRWRKRRGKPRPAQIRLQRQDGTPLLVQIKEYSCPVPRYLFREARILSRREKDELDNKIWTLDPTLNIEDDLLMQIKYPDWNRKHVIKARADKWARMIVKIGYSFACAEYGIIGFNSLVCPIILGESKDFTLLVGGEGNVIDLST